MSLASCQQNVLHHCVAHFELNKLLFLSNRLICNIILTLTLTPAHVGTPFDKGGLELQRTAQTIVDQTILKCRRDLLDTLIEKKQEALQQAKLGIDLGHLAVKMRLETWEPQLRRIAPSVILGESLDDATQGIISRMCNAAWKDFSNAAGNDSFERTCKQMAKDEKAQASQNLDAARMDLDVSSVDTSTVTKKVVNNYKDDIKKLSKKLSQVEGMLKGYNIPRIQQSQGRSNSKQPSKKNNTPTTSTQASTLQRGSTLTAKGDSSKKQGNFAKRPPTLPARPQPQTQTLSKNGNVNSRKRAMTQGGKAGNAKKQKTT
ncbi:BQ5605_C009g05817 [Microbotryum silenes-dioicae]|uniref:BQ5605_C009g05817 protein n=1 Tax=Microbotryum silenes-dioicae TaxID=796604 RepID=A0A2X0ME02_9BASI|nr:BQ5605_C009g05817 [Microbotryum silenes-dioicae]